METRSRLSFIRDLIIKIFLVLLFVFLLTLLFPMPKLTPFYNRIFNDNVQTMKDAAESYFTKERMPEKVGDSSKLTLQQMLDKKLILPFIDRNGNECDTKNSYVKVTKKKTEYELEVHLTCGEESDYIIEPIGCYDFCPDKSCVKEIITDENTGKVVINKPTPTPSNPTPSNPSDKYKLQYLYTRTLTNTVWTVGDYTTERHNETDDVKLVDTKTQYTGKKKVSSGTTTYKHIKSGYKDNWTTDANWTDEVKTLTDTLKLADVRTLYTGQRKYTVDQAKYKHIKYGTKDNWTTDTDWTDEVKTETATLKLADTRTLYTGQRKYYVDTEQYKHIKYGTRDNWTETGYQTTKYSTNDRVVLLGTRYTVRKTVKTTTGGWSDWIKDTTWRTSKPANTADKQWSDAYNKKTTTSKQSVKEIQSVSPLISSGDIMYELLYISNDPCKTNCTAATIPVYHYRQWRTASTTEYQYMYRTYSSSNSTTVDEKVVTDPTPYTNQGYTIVKYEYNYKINNREQYIADTKWTNSKTSPNGYVYANEKKITRTYKYENLNKWVTNKDKLGEYTYNISTRKQYKYKHNNPTKYIVDTKWTNSQTSPSGYVYANEKKIEKVTKYENLNKWVTTPGALGEYTYNISTKKQYKYKHNNPTRYEDIIWTTSINPPAGYTYTGEYKNNSSTTYVDLGRWVDSKSELGEYTYDVQTRKLYKYKYRKTTKTTESKWFDTNPGGDWVYANQTRKIKVN